MFPTHRIHTGASIHLDADKGALRVHSLTRLSNQPASWLSVVKKDSRLRLVEDRDDGFALRFIIPTPTAPSPDTCFTAFLGSSAMMSVGYFCSPSAPRLPPSEQPVDAVLQQLQGLWVGTYGPHGEELLHVRFVEMQAPPPPQEQQEQEQQQEQQQQQQGLTVVCEGLKLTGDVNVPAGEWSFRIDLHRPRDLRAALTTDTRPIFSSATGGGPMDHVLLDLEGEARAGRIHGIYPGRGQINRTPLEWHPEEVPVDLVAFREREGEEGEGGEGEERIPRFCIVWHDDDHPVRHAISFHRFRRVHTGTDALMYGHE